MIQLDTKDKRDYLNPEVFLGIVHNGVHIKYVEMKRSTMSLDLVYAIVGDAIKSDRNTFLIKFDGFNLDTRVVKMIAKTMNSCKLKCYDIRSNYRQRKRLEEEYDEIKEEKKLPSELKVKKTRKKQDFIEKEEEGSVEEPQQKNDTNFDPVSTVVKLIQKKTKKNPTFNLITSKNGVVCELVSLGKVLLTCEGKNTKLAKINCCKKYLEK